MNVRPRIIIHRALFVLLFILYAGTTSVGAAGFDRAPLNPDFVKYRDEPAKAANARGASARPGGYAPSPVDLSHLRNADYSEYFKGRGARGAFPSRYDLREEYAVTPVKNQEPYNNCWAFSAIGSLESAYLKKEGISLDLSEMYLSYYAFMDTVGFTYETADVLQQGGFDNMSVAMMARRAGPVLESDAPYGRRPAGAASSYPNRLHLQHAYHLNLQIYDNQEQPGADIRKELLMNHGAVSVGMYASNYAAYNPSAAAWCNLTKERPDHAVLIVGWDDDYRRDNFNPDYRPAGNGAWLVKNSWGADWGREGYFWVSYGDASLLDGVAYIPAETDDYRNIYSYDELGWCNSAGFGGDTAFMANIFTARSAETLGAVSLYTTSANARYEIAVYTGVTNAADPTSGTLALTQSGGQAIAGYHTIPLDRPIELASGGRFAVTVKMTTPGYKYPLALEDVVNGYSDRAVVHRGESFASADGVNWFDAYDDYSNVCLKAFTDGGTGDPNPSPAPGPGPSTASGGGGGGCSAAGAGLLLAIPAFTRLRRA